MTGSGPRKGALVVDDEVFARIFVTQILLDEGFAPLEAETTVEALDVLETNAHITLLVTDICMPGDRDGLALAHKVAGHFPGVRIILVSGHVRPRLVDMPAGARFLAKPFTGHTLASMIRDSE